MAITVKPANVASQNWVEGAGAASGRYAAGVQGAGSRWQSNTVAAAGTFKQGVSAGNIEQRYAAGAARAGSAKYERKATTLGASRFSGGVSDAKGDYEAGVSPYLSLIGSLTLPARKPRGDPGNLERVRVISSALAARRMGSAAAGR